MRNTLLSKSAATATTTVQPSDIPSIRLIAATPSASGLSSEASTSMNSSWASVPSVPSPIAPKADAAASRKRLVPKKSKLGLLGNKDKEKDKGKDLSDVVRRVGGSTSRRGFEIYVDPTDPEIGEVVMVKKKKSRAGLDGLRWGSRSDALQEVTNIPSVTPPVTATVKVKTEEKEKWWTIGRGRKDSKEKEKEKAREKSKTRPHPPRSKTPEPFKSSSDTQSRARFNSLDSGMLLNTAPTSFNAPNYKSGNNSTPQLLSVQPVQNEEERPSPLSYSRAGTPTLGGFLAPLPMQSEGTNPTQNQNSIALRAMKSVRSLARIGSWAQLKNGGPGEETSNTKEPEKKKDKVKDKSKDDLKKTKKKKEKVDEKKEKKDKEKKERPATVRQSTSSFEAGALTASPDVKLQSLGKKKRSILGLGLPSTMRLPTVRSGSTTSSIGVAEGAGNNNNRLSVESAVMMATRLRSGSVMSTGSSLRPMSTTSSTSHVSSGSSAVSVKWDEEGLETVKELRRKERETKRKSQDDAGTSRQKKTNRESRESRRSSEGRRRTPLSDIFPGIHSEAPDSPASVEIQREPPLLTLEEATSDGHEKASDSAVSTPVKRARPRPLSEQLLGRSRPQGIHEDDGDGVISILSAATNDLAQLINHLDLEATPGTTPGTPNPSPWRHPCVPAANWAELTSDSPTKKTLRKDVTSISSLRPYAQSRGAGLTKSSAPPDGLIGQQIAPWPMLNSFFPQKDSPAKAVPEATLSPVKHLTHKRTMSPPAFTVESSPGPALRPLRPAKSRSAITSLKSLGPPPAADLPPVKTLAAEFNTVRAPSSLTFGSRSSSRGGDSSISSMDDIRERPSNPVLRPAHGHARNRSSLLSSQQGGSQGSIPEEDYTTSGPLAPGARRMLGMKGTMGGSDVSAYAVDDLDASDPDSDIPDELQIILSGQSDRNSIDDTLSFRPPQSPSLPPNEPLSDPESESSGEPEPLDLPIFHAQLIDTDDNCADLEDVATEGEDTKKSFDFTGELKKLNESGGSDRRSFVEQLENAFRTPAKIDLRYDFGGTFKNELLQVEVPPVPPLPADVHVSDSSSSTLDTKASTSSQEVQYGGSSQSKSAELETFPISRLLDTKEPTLLPGCDSIDAESSHDEIPPSLPKALHAKSSSSSTPSNGELNTSFKFGGLSKLPSTELEKPMTLSDIIPPASYVRKLSNASTLSVDDSVINSIMAKASEMPVVRPRVNSDSSSKRRARDTSNILYRHSRHSSGISFDGFDSFEEVRRGFEFHDYRPSFYPPPVTTAARRNIHGRQDSVMSFASVSSYGHVLNPGIPDPFDYGLPSLRERPSSEDMSSVSMSMSVDDTFSFLNHRPQRRRVESDASSFYFRASAPSRGHRRNESNMSVISQGPPISLYNRSYGGHRRNDSSTSVSSIAHSYAMHGANGGRAAWARHRQEASVDSVDSQFSAMRLGRPGIGDKMFDTANHAAPLTSISASPPESHIGDRMDLDNMENRSSIISDVRSSYDSILDDERRFSTEDSLFDKTGNRTSVSSESVFGYDDSQYPQEHLLPPNSFRPLSSMSVASIHSPMKEDDTMISMLGGGHVRRRSVGSVIEASPCVRIGKRKQPPFETVRALKGIDENGPAIKARIIEKPSIVSTSSSKFGGERMIRARKGILERQSLEESCLIAEGEDLSVSFQNVPVFTRPGPASRSRSSTCTSSSSGGDTPPLSPSVGSSASEGGSMSSIDLSHVNMLLANSTHPMANTARDRVRTRARGQGHRRRISQARASRSSVYETIEEEMSSTTSSPVAPSAASKKSSPTALQPVFIVEPDTASIHSTESFWDDERGIVALRRYYELRDEAEYTVMESKRIWLDTPFSIYALQGFEPPRHPAGMKALLADSQQSYGPLPSELRPRRRRTSSRPSPYPQRTVKVSLSPDSVRRTGIVPQPSNRSVKSTTSPPLQPIPVNRNIDVPPPVPTVPGAMKVFFPPNVDTTEIKAQVNNVGPNAVRPRVASTARRTALGWSKRSTGKSSADLKENSFGQGVGMTPNESLRLSRPRPRGRPTPARAIRA